MSKRRKRLSPDDEFLAGPLHYARFGKLIRVQNTWTDEENEEWKRSVLEQHDTLVTRINTLIEEIADHVSRISPLHLMLCARSFFESQWMNVETEAETGSSHVHSQRMIDYIQSLIAAVEPHPRKTGQLTPELWTELSEKTEELFLIVTRDYLLSWMVKREHERGDSETRADLYVAMLTVFWMQVRGRRYAFHEPQYLRDVFLPHSELLKDVYGVTGEELTGALTSILRSLTGGLGDVLLDLNALRKTLERPDDGPIRSEDDLRERAASAAGGEAALKDLLDRAFGAARFDVQRITDLPDALLDDLTWSPGEDREFLAEGKYPGWPLRVWPVFKRPLLRLDGHVYCFDPTTLFDHIYRVIQRALTRRCQAHRERWNQAQQGLSERLALQYFQQLLPSAECWQSVYYRKPGRVGRAEWCETDALVAFDRHLFVIECRAGSFTYTAPATDFEGQVRSLKNLVTKPADQGHRFIDYLRSAESVDLFNRTHDVVGTMRARDFDHVVVCGITLDAFTELAAGAKQLVKLGAELDCNPLWSLSIDDLRVFSDLFDEPLHFLHFVQERQRALTNSTVLEFNDEIDHVGLYFKHGNYIDHFDRLDGVSSLSPFGYRADIDRFFTARMTEPDVDLRQANISPPVVREIVSVLSRSGRPGRFRVAKHLLDLPQADRVRLQEGILGELRAQRFRRSPRAKAVSTVPKDGLTVFCWMPPWSVPNSEPAVQHSRAVACLHKDTERLHLELTFTEDHEIEDVLWQWIDTRSIPEHLRTQLARETEALRSSRVAAAQAKVGKIGRNAPCPCGSGRKWKRCCLLRR